ncbi:hypothetical protein SLEP1_g19102 [Rubroshorea leprosula]|nr:hypothetical protein SLEP1_g19102 [Rubroshorea leprosula]
MTRYLYYETPLEFLNEGDRGFYILQQCIARKMFGISVEAYAIKEDKHQERNGRTIQMIEENKQEWISQRKNQERNGRTIQEIQRKNQERNGKTIQERIRRKIQDIRRKNREMFPGTAVSPLKRAMFLIIAIPYHALHLSVSLVWVAVFSVCGITTLILLCLGILILEALSMLVSTHSKNYETHLYQLKLMDEYAREVIHLICDRSLSELDQSKAVEATFQAIKNGIPGIVKKIIEANANNVLWCNKDPEDPLRNIFACAIAHRQEEVAHFLYESQKEKNMLFDIDEDGNNTLHLAAKLAPNYKSGYIYAAALQLQSELRWFKAVKEIVPGAYKKGKNTDNETPLEVFVREHKELLKEAEEWVKKTAESSTVVGALIITIMFAVALTVPGGNDEGEGFPVLLHKTPTPFMIFMVSDAISLFTASSSVIMFLGILTSHHSDEDYRKTFLLIIGLTSLFVSIATMTTAFCAALFMMLQGQGGLGLVIPITLFAGIPIVCYVLLQFPLLVEILGLT